MPPPDRALVRQDGLVGPDTTRPVTVAHTFTETDEDEAEEVEGHEERPLRTRDTGRVTVQNRAMSSPKRV